VKLAPILMQRMKREQRLIETNDKWYVAEDISTGTKYICFKDLLMIDIDNKSAEFIDDKFIIEYFGNMKTDAFIIYKTRAGYHVFCVSREFEYRNKETIKFMLENFADYYYTIYSYIRGFSVRLNRKFNENLELDMYTYLGTYGEKSLIRNDLVELVNKHVEFTDKYKNEFNMMECEIN
jgi:hypothetical protein